MRISAAQMKTAVAWWKAKLRCPDFDSISPSLRDSPTFASDRLVALLVKSKVKIGPTQIDAFGDLLLRHLAKEGFQGELTATWEPKGILASVCAGAGIEIFPCRYTLMTFDNGGVQIHADDSVTHLDLLN